jgi:Fe-S oxidoreductase
MSDFDQEPLLEVTEALVESGGRALLDCLQCGTCSGVCPHGLVRPHSVRHIVRQAALGLEGFEPLSWLCLTCNACVDRCPQQIDLTAVMQSMRAVAAEMGGLPPGVSAAVGSLSAAGNPWGGEQGDRTKWTEALPSVESATEPAESVAYFTCCTPAYDAKAKTAAVAAVTLLRESGYDVSMVGEGEVCCGDLALRAGRADLAEKLARKNLKAIEQTQAPTVVTSSPHCWQAFTGWYPDVAGKPPKSYHVAELLHDALAKGNFPAWRRSISARVTYHDPCYLGRHGDVYEAPRELLRAIPGLELVEMSRSRENAICCGGGGGGAFRETPQEERHALLRVDDARQKGASIIVTACPLCLLMLEDALRVRNLEEKIQVRDLADLLWEATREAPQEAP